MNKLVLFIATIALLIFLTGCTQDPLPPIKPSGLISDNCLMPAGFECTGQSLTNAESKGVLQFIVKNNVGKAVTFNEVTATESNGAICTWQQDTKTVLSEDNYIFILDCDKSFEIGKKNKFTTSIEYVEENNRFDKVITASITATVR